jgi:lipid-binding SYLF domain-containing protein
MSLSKLLGFNLLALSLAACAVTPVSSEGRATVQRRAKAVLSEEMAEDANLAARIRDAHACAVFPRVAKGGLVLGLELGTGVLYERGQVVGFCELSQTSLGAQLGLQSYAEIICFETEAAASRFKCGVVKPHGQAGAVAGTLGQSAIERYDEGLAIFARNEIGLMVEASVGIQSFRYEPIDPLLGGPALARR